MKFQKGATVILLDITFKPVGSATVKNVNTATLQYEVEYVYPNSANVETIWVVQERLTTLLPNDI